MFLRGFCVFTHFYVYSQKICIFYLRVFLRIALYFHVFLCIFLRITMYLYVFVRIHVCIYTWIYWEIRGEGEREATCQAQWRIQGWVPPWHKAQSGSPRQGGRTEGISRRSVVKISQMSAARSARCRLQMSAVRCGCPSGNPTSCYSLVTYVWKCSSVDYPSTPT